MERSLAEIDLATGNIARGLLRDRRARSLEREIAVTRKRLQAKRAELDAKRQRLRALEQRVEVERRVAKLFRLHSSQHHLECSERRFARLARSQSELPILVARQDGRRWWWFRDRFWWDDQGLAAENVRTIVLEADLDRKQRAEAIATARAAILGEHVAAAPLPPAAQVVRFAVWCRDKGRCVDCSTRRTRCLRSDPPVRRRRIRCRLERRAALRALQGAAGGERGARPGSASAG